MIVFSMIWAPFIGYLYMYPYRGGGGGIQVHCIWYNRCDNIWLLFSLAGTQTHVWIDLATGCTSIVFFFRLATNLTGTCMSF